MSESVFQFVLFATIAASAVSVFIMLWTIGRAVEFEEKVSDLRVEAHRLLEQRERRLRALRGEDDEAVGVTILPEPDEEGQEVEDAVAEAA